MEIVINRCYGGFGLSLAATQRAAELGSEIAKEDLKVFNETGKESDFYGYGFSDHRSDPILIKVVRELKSAANGKFSSLSIVDVPDGIDYYIDEYDGIESIHEEHRSWS